MDKQIPHETLTALITGATSGIGASFAEELGRIKYNLILQGRQEEKLRNFGKMLEKLYGIQTTIVITELSNSEGFLILEKIIQNLEHLDFLINNAGYYISDDVINQEPEELQKMIYTHTIIPVQLINSALKKMIKQKSGNIINVSSLYAYFPIPGRENYAATKAYLLTLSKALYPTLHSNNINIQALVPGPVKTEFRKRNGKEAIGMDPKEVVKESLKNLKQGKKLCIPGFKNRLLLKLMLIFSRFLKKKMLLNK